MPRYANSTDRIVTVHEGIIRYEVPINIGNTIGTVNGVLQQNQFPLGSAFKLSSATNEMI